MITARSDVGGGPKHVYDLAKGLKGSGAKIYLTIASPSDPPNFSKFLDVFDHHLFIPHRRFSFFCFLKILLFCRLNSVQIVHSHGRGAGYYSRPLSLFGIQVVHTFHGAHVEDSLSGKVKNIIDRFFSLFPQKFICVSNDEREIVLNLGWADKLSVHVVHNGVDQNVIAKKFSTLTKEEARDKFGLAQSKKIYGTLSRLTYQKGIDLLLESQDLLKFDEDTLFVVAGGGEDLEKLKTVIANKNIQNVILLGEVNEPIEFLRALDGYFSFARWEGFPLSVLEAFAVGLPCVISDVSGHQDLKEHCHFFHPSIENDFFDAITVAKIKKSSDSFSIENMTAKTLQVYLS